MCFLTKYVTRSSNNNECSWYNQVIDMLNHKNMSGLSVFIGFPGNSDDRIVSYMYRYMSKCISWGNKQPKEKKNLRTCTSCLLLYDFSVLEKKTVNWYNAVIFFKTMFIPYVCSENINEWNTLTRIKPFESKSPVYSIQNRVSYWPCNCQMSTLCNKTIYCTYHQSEMRGNKNAHGSV